MTSFAFVPSPARGDACSGVASAPPLVSHAQARLWIAVLLGFGLFMRIIAASQIASLPLLDAPTAEASVALQRAAEIARGSLAPLRPLDGGALYPYLIAGLLAIAGPGFTVVAIAQAIAGIAAVGLLALTARRLYGAAAGVATAALGALYGPFAFLEADTLDAAWVQLAIAAALWALMRWRDAHASRTRFAPVLPAAAGFALGLAVLQRPQLVGLIPFAIAWVALRSRSVVVTAAALAAVLLPAAVSVLLATDAGSFPSTHGADSYAGNHPGARGTPAEPWVDRGAEFAARPGDARQSSRAAAEAGAQRRLSHEQASAYWGERAAAFVRERPHEAAALVARKAALAFAAAEIPSDLDYAFVRERAWALGALPVGFGVVLPFAAIGIGFAFAERRRRAEALLLASCALAVAAGMIPFFVSDRLRAPMVLPLLIAAGGGVAALIRIAANPDARREPRVLGVMVVACACTVLSVLPLTADGRARDWWLLARALEQRGDLPAVASAYEKAADADVNDRTRGFVLERLSATYERMGLPDLALTTMRNAVSTDPDRGGAHRHLGMLYASQSEPTRALAELREAVRLGAKDSELLGVIAALLAFGGKNTEARGFYARAVALAPTDTRLVQLAREYPALTGIEPVATR